MTSIIDILLLNDYPLDFIFDSINHRIKNLIRNRHRLHDTETDIDLTNKPASWLTVPFIPLHTEKLRSLNKSKSDIRVAFHSPNKMDKYIRVQKDTCPSTSKSNVVYKILCNDCDASYVGQTGRQLKTRIAEHRNHIILDIKLLFCHHRSWVTSQSRFPMGQCSDIRQRALV